MGYLLDVVKWCLDMTSVFIYQTYWPACKNTSHQIALLLNVINMFIVAHCVCCQSVSDQVRSIDIILTTWWLIPPPPSLSQRTVNGTGCTVLEDFWQANLRIKGTILEKELPAATGHVHSNADKKCSFFRAVVNLGVFTWVNWAGGQIKGKGWSMGVRWQVCRRRRRWVMPN